MRLGGRAPGIVTSFVDGASGAVLLQLSADPRGTPLIAFRLFDAAGNLVSDSEGFQSYPDGLRLCSEDEEVLLLLPSEPRDNIQYRLYSPSGSLLTASDGARTQILPGLRIDGTKATGKRAAAPDEHESFA